MSKKKSGVACLIIALVTAVVGGYLKGYGDAEYNADHVIPMCKKKG